MLFRLRLRFCRTLFLHLSRNNCVPKILLIKSCLDSVKTHSISNRVAYCERGSMKTHIFPHEICSLMKMFSSSLSAESVYQWVGVDLYSGSLFIRREGLLLKKKAQAVKSDKDNGKSSLLPVTYLSQLGCVKHVFARQGYILRAHVLTYSASLVHLPLSFCRVHSSPACMSGTISRTISRSN